MLEDYATAIEKEKKDSRKPSEDFHFFRLLKPFLTKKGDFSKEEAEIVLKHILFIIQHLDKKLENDILRDDLLPFTFKLSSFTSEFSIILEENIEEGNELLFSYILLHLHL